MSDESPPAKRLKSNFSETFDVLVGIATNQKRFTVHHDTITKRSRLLRATQFTSSTDGSSRLFQLREHDPDSFARYLHCVYWDVVPKITLPSEDESTTKGSLHAPSATTSIIERSPAEGDALFEALVKLYILADALRDFLTANMVIDEIKAIGSSREEYPSAKAVTLAYRLTTEGNALRKLLVDLHIRTVDQLSEGSYPRGLLQKVVQEFMRWKRMDQSMFGGSNGLLVFGIDKIWPCAHHQHDDENPNAKCKISTEWHAERDRLYPDTDEDE